MILYTLTHTSRKSPYHYPRTITTWYVSMVRARDALRAQKAQGGGGEVAQVNVPTTSAALIVFLDALCAEHVIVHDDLVPMPRGVGGASRHT